MPVYNLVTYAFIFILPKWVLKEEECEMSSPVIKIKIATKGVVLFLLSTTLIHV